MTAYVIIRYTATKKIIKITITEHQTYDAWKNSF